jgi:hypothetical protein
MQNIKTNAAIAVRGSTGSENISALSTGTVFGSIVGTIWDNNMPSIVENIYVLNGNPDPIKQYNIDIEILNQTNTTNIYSGAGFTPT